MEPGQGSQPFSSAAWTFALAMPGYRMLAEFGTEAPDAAGAPAVRLRSRRGVDAARWFPEVAEALAALRLPRTVVDGVICVLDAAGRSDLQRLHERAVHPGQRPGTSAVVMCLQDVLVWEGCDVRALPWRERRDLLRQLPLQDHPVLRPQLSVGAEGDWLYRQAQAVGHEAIDARRRDARYEAGLSMGWLHISCAAAPGGAD